MYKALKAVLWAFFGVRKGAEHKKDISSLKIWHIVSAGIFSCFVFVLSLLVIIRLLII